MPKVPFPPVNVPIVLLVSEVIMPVLYKLYCWPEMVPELERLPIQPLLSMPVIFSPVIRPELFSSVMDPRMANPDTPEMVPELVKVVIVE